MYNRFIIALWFMVLVAISINSESASLPRGMVRAKSQSPQEIASSLYKESHALVIGASDYQFWPRLPGVKKDVEAVVAALKLQGFEVVLVLNPDHSALRNAFEDFIANYGHQPEARLLFYFAGHGYTRKTGYNEDMGYIVPVDAPTPTKDPDGLADTALDMQQIEVYAKRIDAKHALFLFDSCFSGSLFAISRKAVPPAVISYKTAMPVRQFITSGSADEEVPDQSIFREQLVDALAGEADSNGDGYVTGSELGLFLQTRVINYSSNAQHPQYGTIRNSKLDKGDFVFGVVTSSPPLPPLPNLPGASNFSLADLTAQAQHEEQERSIRTQWANWQTQMQASFTQVSGFVGSAKLRRAAWQRFLTDYAKDDPYSSVDEQLRTEARQRQIAIADDDVPPVNSGLPAASVDTKISTRKDFEPELVDIPAGIFMMGSHDTEANRDSNEGPVHQVTVAAFQMGKYELTRGQFRAFVDATGYKTEAEQGDGCYGWNGSSWEQNKAYNWKNLGFSQTDVYPVTCISWNDAQAYVKWLSQQTGKQYMLPTEAEWEYAARASTTTARFWGDDSNSACQYANVADQAAKHQFSDWPIHECNDGYIFTAPVGQFKPNSFGLYDMLGNVWEWCQDPYHNDYNGALTIDSIWESGASSGKMLRGGSWSYDPANVRSAARSFLTSSARGDGIGVRVVSFASARM